MVVPTPSVVLQGDGKDIYVVVNGTRIAKRGRPGTPQAGTWISLEPGWQVTGTKEITVTYNGAAVH